MSLAPRVCTRCNAIIPDGHHYCGRCGSRHDEDGSAAMQTLFYGPLQAPGRSKLILICGDAIEGMSYHLNATEHICGRDSSVIPFDDDLISPEHANFFYRDNKLYVRDEGSVNGTFVRIHEPRVLHEGDIIRAGDHLFRFESLDVEPEPVMPDETTYYGSPTTTASFRLSEIAAGGVRGTAYASPNNELAVGREGCDLSFPNDPHMSGRHFKIVDKDRTARLFDLNSKNGTFVRLREPMRLGHGDYVFIGRQLLRVEIAV